MSFSKVIFDLAAQEIENRRNTAENEYEKRRLSLIRKCPEYLIIEKQMKDSAMGILKVLGMGENAQEYIETLRKTNLQAQEEIKRLLISENLSEDYLEIPYTCKACNDTGFKDGKICECNKNLLKKIAIERLSKEAPMKLSSFEDFDLSYYHGESFKQMTQILSYLKEYAKDFDLSSYSLFMMGETGLGKTHISLAIAKEAINKGYNVFYGSAQDLFSKIEASHFGRSDKYNDLEDMMVASDLLIIDDLGAEFSTNFTVSVLYNIINSRMLCSKPTIINTNLNNAELEKRYTRRITSRIIGEYQILHFSGNDIRQLKKD